MLLTEIRQTITAKTERRQQQIDAATTLLASTAITPEQRTQIETHFTEARQLATDVALLKESLTASEERDAAAAAAETERRNAVNAGKPALPNPGAPEDRSGADKAQLEERNRQHRSAMTKYVQTGDTTELRAMGTTAGPSGGFFIPLDLADTVEQAILTYGGVAQHLGQLNTSAGETIDYPMSNDVANAAVIVGENSGNVGEQDIVLTSTPSNVSTLTTKYVLVSNQVLQDSKFDLDNFINDNLVERSNRGLSGYIMGGSQDGNFVSLTSVPVGHQTTAGTNFAIGLPDIGALFGAVDPAYAARGKWVMNRQTQLYLANLRNQLGAPIFTLDQTGQLTNLYGQPIVIDTTTPAIAASSTPIVFGDLQKQVLRRVSGFGIRRLNELFALANQTAFVGFFRAGCFRVDAGTHPIQSLQMAAN